MDLMGVGLPEMAVILLVAFLVLGPKRSIDMARTAGKVLGGLRRSFNEVAAAASLEQTEQAAARRDSPAVDQRKAPNSNTGDE